MYTGGMRYLFTVLIIALSWVVITVLMPLVPESKHFILYVLAMANTLVLYLIGFRNN